MSLTIGDITYTKFPEGENRGIFVRDYYKIPEYKTRIFYYIAPDGAPVLLGKYADNNTILKNGNDVLTGDPPVDNNEFIETYMFRNEEGVKNVSRSNPFIYYTIPLDGGRRRKTNRKKSKRRKTKRRKSNRRR